MKKQPKLTQEQRLSLRGANPKIRAWIKRQMKAGFMSIIIACIFTGCGWTNLTEPIVITSITSSETAYYNKYKYIVYINNKHDLYIYTNTLYSVGDTLKIIPKK